MVIRKTRTKTRAKMIAMTARRRGLRASISKKKRGFGISITRKK